MTAQTFTAGQTVYLAADYARDFPQLAGVKLVIEKVPVGARGVNYVARPADGGRGIKGGAYLFQTDAPQTAAEVIGQPYVPPMLPGTVVRFKSQVRNTEGLWVVIAESGTGYRLFPVGGSSRYLRNVKAAQVEVIAAERITVTD